PRAVRLGARDREGRAGPHDPRGGLGISPPHWAQREPRRDGPDAPEARPHRHHGKVASGIRERPAAPASPGRCPRRRLECRDARRCAALTPASPWGSEPSWGSQAALVRSARAEERRPLVPDGTVGFALTQPKEDADGPLYSAISDWMFTRKAARWPWWGRAGRGSAYRWSRRTGPR